MPTPPLGLAYFEAHLRDADCPVVIVAVAKGMLAMLDYIHELEMKVDMMTEASSETPSCGTCRFFLVSQCRRYPPTVLQQSSRDVFPNTDKEYWCGEWKGK